MMNCGECLMRDAAIVALVDGVCPKCGTDYRQEMAEMVAPEGDAQAANIGQTDDF